MNSNETPKGLQGDICEELKMRYLSIIDSKSLKSHVLALQHTEINIINEIAP